jgi:hypothetical protein
MNIFIIIYSTILMDFSQELMLKMEIFKEFDVLVIRTDRDGGRYIKWIL